jgi:hypothetical protein
MAADAIPVQITRRAGFSKTIFFVDADFSEALRARGQVQRGEHHGETKFRGPIILLRRSGQQAPQQLVADGQSAAIDRALYADALELSAEAVRGLLSAWARHQRAAATPAAQPLPLLVGELESAVHARPLPHPCPRAFSPPVPETRLRSKQHGSSTSPQQNPSPYGMA